MRQSLGVSGQIQPLTSSPLHLFTRSSPRRGFTLVELLVVITIIGILAGLASVAAYKVFVVAKGAAIKADITNLESALTKYRDQYGDYPPSDMTDTNLNGGIVRHLKKAFPRCNPVAEMAAIPRANGSYNSGPAMTPAQALVFWLQGFGPDKQRPLSGPLAGVGERTPIIDFNKTRLVRPDTGEVYVAPTSATVYVPMPVYKAPSGDQPYVYFHSRSYLWHSLDQFNSLTAWKMYGPARPYLLAPWEKSNVGTLDLGTNPTTAEVLLDGNGDPTPASYQKICANPKSFQIVSAGPDGDFGTSGATLKVIPSVTYASGDYPLTYKSYPDGLGYVDEDNDNLTNFSEKSLSDAKPE